jgi:hypothetical protein|tara:strand:+ start:15636 stop:15830 length:195 start_codon:yes stop_codon:yes gene_type:complete
MSAEVIQMPPMPPSPPIVCSMHDCNGKTFFVYLDGLVRCASCGTQQWQEEQEITFTPDPDLFDG